MWSDGNLTMLLKQIYCALDRIVLCVAPSIPNIPPDVAHKETGNEWDEFSELVQ